MNICVFCSANNLPKKYTEPAKELARLIAQSGHTLVWGGSDYGMMKLMAENVQKGGGKIIGISVETFRKYARKDADEMIIAKNMSERKALLLEKSEVIVMLVGGIGTLDETTEILELKKQGQHDKKIIILNSAGFYDGLKMQLEIMAAEGFLPVREQDGVKLRTLDELVLFVDNPNEVIQAITI